MTDSALLNFLIVVRDSACARAWIVFCLGAPLVFPAASPTRWIYLASGALCAAVVALVCRAGGNTIALMRRLLFRITPFALLASGILIPLAIRANSELLMACGFVVGGIGAGPLQVLWGDRFSHHSVQFAAFASPAAAIVTASVAALSASQTSFMGFIVVPLLSFGLLVFHADRTGHPWRELVGKSDLDSSRDSAPQSAVAEPAEAARAQPTGFRAGSRVPLGVGKLMFSIMTFSLLCRMFDTMNRGVDPLAFLGGSPIFALVVVGAAFIAIVAKAGERFNPTLIYRLSLPIMVAGYVAIALLFDSHAAISLLIINVGYEFFDILTWVLFVDASRRRNENALYIFGLGVAFMFCGMALGNAASHILDTLVSSGNVQANVVAMAAILCLVIVAFLVLPEGTVAQLSRREGHAERGAARATESGVLGESEAGDGAASSNQAEGASTADRIERALRRRGPRLRAHSRARARSSCFWPTDARWPSSLAICTSPRAQPVPISRTSTASWTCTSSRSSSIWWRTTKAKGARNSAIGLVKKRVKRQPIRITGRTSPELERSFERLRPARQGESPKRAL